MVQLDLREMSAQECAALRTDVLRGGRSDLSLGDETPAYHVGLFAGDRLVATGNIRPEAPEHDAENPGAWRIRGMATDPDHRGAGAGSRLLIHLLDHAETCGATLVWCHARVPAQRFYERHGFTAYGDPWFEPPPFGPHVEMTRVVGPTAT